MKFNAETKMLGFIETDFESAAEQSVEADISLPDYCPEIKRILKCTVTADILMIRQSLAVLQGLTEPPLLLLRLKKDTRQRSVPTVISARRIRRVIVKLCDL